MSILLCGFSSCVNLPQLIVYIRICGNGRADIDADRCCVNQLDMFNSFCLNGPDMLRHLFAVTESIQRRNKALQDQGCFT